MEETLVSLETAKLLKEKGFDMDAGYAFYFDKDKWVESFYIYTEDEKELFLARPRQSLAQKWLREKYQLHITIFSSSQESWMYRVTNPHQKLEDGLYGEDYYTYEEALEAALYKALSLIN